ncbi:MAG: DUF2802 domain-containing protein [Gammaproteobacteria bacterium]|nr:DUF2802 domain-containing protein [Gammaproteobacteria bacterium]
MPTLWIAFSTIGLLLAVLIVALQRIQRQQREMSLMKRRLDGVASDLNALCAGAVGVDRRITQLEDHNRQLDQRQESLEIQQQDERPYGEAIQLVHKGATAAALVENLGLSRSEAELVVMLHGVRKAS